MDLKISDKGFRLATEWVKSMSGGERLDNEDTEEFELREDERPARLGLGAEYMHHSQLTNTLNPVEKKLKAKLDVTIRAAHCQETKRLRTHVDTNKAISMKVDKENMDAADEDGSRASQFSRKQCSRTSISQLEPSHPKKKKNKAGQVQCEST